MSSPDEPWFDEAAGPLVRPYAVTRGRTRNRHAELQMITLVVALDPQAGHRDPGRTRGLDPEHLQILALSRMPVSIAELSGELGLPMSVVKILIGDLIERHLVAHRDAAVPDLDMLQAVMHGIRRL